MKNKSKIKLTRFQWKVLSITATIPLGETRSYQWVAQKTGSPKAVRAVGQALRRNPYPVIIPCHRVIHADGSLGAYAGKFDKRKAQLLEKEREITAAMAVRLPSGGKSEPFLLNPRAARSRMKGNHGS